MAIISNEQLKNCQRLLFISPIALGDFLYLKTFLIALKAAQPHIEIDIWLDDNRCNQDSWRLSRSTILQQWIAAEASFHGSYGCTDSVASRDLQIETAKQQQYDIVICHSPAGRASQFSKIARRIAPKGFIVSSITAPLHKGLFNWWLLRASDKVYTLDSQSLPSNHHITDRFYTILHDILGLSMDKKAFMPTLVVPNDVIQHAQQWINCHLDGNSTVVLINHLSTNSKRDWSESQVIDLINSIHQHQPETRFIINVTKEQFTHISQVVATRLADVQSKVAVFTIKDNFFELPAIIAAVDWVITVETAIMHFATAAQTPLIALMRSKKPYWAPPASTTSQVLYASKGKGHVCDIDTETVFKQYLTMSQ
ncbi:glycosyltransferase family 9 protein [Shewanella sp. 10N.286.51.B2]|uniref:glycosyltransferase family 9 protein n=1 Tax=Shewanella sp. 10N.286.51.B2 TaxID=3229707 RepID=UPI00354EE456